MANPTGAQVEPSNKASLSDKEQGVLRAARPQMSEEDRLALSGGELNPKAEMSRGEGGDEPWRGLIQKTSFSSSFKDQGDDQKEQWKKLSKAEKMGCSTSTRVTRATPQNQWKILRRILDTRVC